MTGIGDKQQLKKLPGLKAHAFQHPWDIKAIESLKAIPGFDFVCSKVMEYGFERAYYLMNTADNVKVTSRMYPKLHKYLEWATGVLDLPAMPELYVTVDPVPNAFTYGQTKPFITVTSGLLDVMDEKERFFVVAHELGHIKCEHSLYTMVANNISTVMKAIGQVTLGIGTVIGAGLEMALLDWKRKSELSADRAGLLATQDRDVAMSVFMKLAGGAPGLASQMSPQEFMKQIREYEDADESKLNQAYKSLLVAFRSHPFPIMRAKHLDAWIEDGSYERVTGIKPKPAFEQPPSA